MSVAARFSQILAEGCRLVVTAFRRAPQAIALALLMAALPYVLSRVYSHFSYGWNMAISFAFGLLSFYLTVGIASVFLRLLRTGQGRWSDLIWHRAGFSSKAFFGAFLIQYAVSGLLSWTMRPMLQILVERHQFEAVMWLQTCYGLAFFAVVIFFFPLPYLLCDERRLGPVDLVQRTWELVSGNAGWAACFFFLQAVISFLPNAFFLLSREVIIDPSIQDGVRPVFQGIHWGWEFFFPFLAVALYERCRLRVEAGAESVHELRTES